MSDLPLRWLAAEVTREEAGAAGHVERARGWEPGERRRDLLQLVVDPPEEDVR